MNSQSLKLLLIVGSGSAVGGMCRYLLSKLIHAKTLTIFPVGTLIVNITGCFLIGLLFAISEKGNFYHDWKLFLITGLLGGFTTYSAFSIETFGLMREGQILYAMSYIAASVIFGLLATYIGFTLVKLF